MNDPIKLYQAANRAAADATRMARDPNGSALARLRRSDAEALRSRARQMLRGVSA